MCRARSMERILESLRRPSRVVGTLKSPNRTGNDRVTRRERIANRCCGWGQRAGATRLVARRARRAPRPSGNRTGPALRSGEREREREREIHCPCRCRLCGRVCLVSPLRIEETVCDKKRDVFLCHPKKKGRAGRRDRVPAQRGASGRRLRAGGSVSIELRIPLAFEIGLRKVPGFG